MAVFLGCAGVAGAQDAPAPQAGYQAPTLTVTARRVVLDVVVTDKKGNLVPRVLGKDDFTVYEDGKVQTVRSFEPPAEHAMPAVAGNAGATGGTVHSAADLKAIGDAPVTVLVIDELNSRFEDSSYARQMLVKYLQAQPAVLPQPAVLMAASNTTFQQLHDYTQDRDALVQAVKKHMPEFPWRMQQSGAKGAGAVERMAQVLAALQQIAQASQGTPGRKNLIWVGNGFPSANLVGLPNDEGATIEAAFRRVTARLLAARITLYTINPTADSSSMVDAETPDDLNFAGNEGGPDPFGEGTVAFSKLAPATGGVAFTGRNDLNNVIGESIAKGQAYYTLSYAPTNGGEQPAKFRTIRIVMKDANLRATTRDGYYPETAADMNPVLDRSMDAKQVAANLKLDLSNALTTTLSYNGLSVTATRTGGDLAVHVAENGIAWSEPGADGRQHEEATVAAAWYDAKGRLLGHVAREEISERGGGGATFALPVALPSGVVRLRLVVRDALNGKMGTVDVTKF
jgi:VWFA-related protein